MDNGRDSSATRWPIDFDAIQKGDTFTPARLEEIIGATRNANHYRFSVLSLRDRIMRELELRNRPATVAIIKGCLCVLTDEQASVYTQRQCCIKIRGHFRNLRRMRNVCIENLSAEQRKAHERSLCVEGMVAASIRKTKRALLLEPHKRATPALTSNVVE